MKTASKTPKVSGLNAKFQLVITADLRKLYHINHDTVFVIKPTEQGILLQPVQNPLHHLRGALKKATKKTSLEIKAEIRNEELIHEKNREQKLFS